jgi:hypothetical protein
VLPKDLGSSRNLRSNSSLHPTSLKAARSLTSCKPAPLLAVDSPNHIIVVSYHRCPLVNASKALRIYSSVLTKHFVHQHNISSASSEGISSVCAGISVRTVIGNSCKSCPHLWHDPPLPRSNLRLHSSAVIIITAMSTMRLSAVSTTRSSQIKVRWTS